MRHRRNVHDSHSFDAGDAAFFGCFGGMFLLWLCLIALPVLAVIGLLKWVF